MVIHLFTNSTFIIAYLVQNLCCTEVYILFFKIFYWILGFGVHEQSMQDSCVGTHMAVCFSFLSPPSPTFGISPQAIPLHLPLPLALPFSPQ